MITPEKLTHKAQESLAKAFELARKNRNPQIEDLHLLLILLSETGGLIPNLLEKADADPVQLIKVAEEKIEGLPQIGEATGVPRLSATMLSALDRAANQAQKMGDEYTAQEHLFLALLLTEC